MLAVCPIEHLWDELEQWARPHHHLLTSEPDLLCLDEHLISKVWGEKAVLLLYNRSKLFWVAGTSTCIYTTVKHRIKPCLIRSEMQETLLTAHMQYVSGDLCFKVGHCGSPLWGPCQEMPTALISLARSETERNQLESQIQDLVDYWGSYGRTITLIPIDFLSASNMSYEIYWMLMKYGVNIFFATCSSWICLSFKSA